MSNKLNQSTETEDDEDISMISPNDVLNDPKTPLRRRFINQTMTKAQNGQTISPVSQKFRNVKENDETGENTYANNNNNNNNLTNLQVSSTPLNFKKISKNSVNNNNIKNLDFENGTTINNDDEKIFNGSSIPNLTKYDYKSINLNNTYSNSNSNSQQNDNENNNEDLENSRILNVSEKAHFFFDKNQIQKIIN
ncbi:unnamed protein product [[Candida] boidinii]|nr:unnamed protein product [[Candida] boidinii]